MIKAAGGGLIGNIAWRPGMAGINYGAQQVESAYTSGDDYDHAERLADIALEEAENENSQDTELSRIEPKIEMINISYRYADGEPWVIRDLSLTIYAGESVAIVGHSGCGKSTLFKTYLSNRRRNSDRRNTN